MSRVHYPNTLTVKPATTEERKWIEELDRLLARCPKRLELLTIGDSGIAVVDRDGALAGDLHDGHAERRGIVLAHVLGGPLVHGVSG